MLVGVNTGVPDFDTTVYVLTQLRATGKATNTIEHHLRSIVVLKVYLLSESINLEERIRSSQMLHPHELDGLIRCCKRPLQETLADLDLVTASDTTQVANIKKVKQRRRKHADVQVCGQTGVNRVHAIRDFLGWLIRERAAQFSLSARNIMIEAWEQCRLGLDARVSTHRRRNQIGYREGLPPETIELLFSLTSPTSDQNPWKSNWIRVRNQLLLFWFYQLGLRRGELLNVKIGDIDFRAETVTIARRADDAADPRRHQPLVKTRDRKLPLAPSLISLTLEYIIKYRATRDGACRHEYLFVSERSGMPLSLSMVNEIFASIRDSFPGHFDDLSPHTLRHTWNDNYSTQADELKLPPGEETSMRSFLMGWSPTSDTAATYTRRHIRQKAQKVSLVMQTKILGKGTQDE